MADNSPNLSIDSDWKKQAQEEKARLDAEARKAQAQPPQRPPVVAGAAGAPQRSAGAADEAAGLPAASFEVLIQTMASQAMMGMGAAQTRSGQPALDLDAAKFHIDLLTIIDQKTKGNLSEQERRMLDGVLYELRGRFVSIASRISQMS